MPETTYFPRYLILGGAMISGVLLALAAGAAVWMSGGNAGQTQLTSLSSTSSARSGHMP